MTDHAVEIKKILESLAHEELALADYELQMDIIRAQMMIAASDNKALKNADAREASVLLSCHARPDYREHYDAVQTIKILIAKSKAELEYHRQSIRLICAAKGE